MVGGVPRNAHRVGATPPARAQTLGDAAAPSEQQRTLRHQHRAERDSSSHHGPDSNSAWEIRDTEVAFPIPVRDHVGCARGRDASPSLGPFRSQGAFRWGNSSSSIGESRRAGASSSDAGGTRAPHPSCHALAVRAPVRRRLALRAGLLVKRRISGRWSERPGAGSDPLLEAAADVGPTRWSDSYAVGRLPSGQKRRAGGLRDRPRRGAARRQPRRRTRSPHDFPRRRRAPPNARTHSSDTSASRRPDVWTALRGR